MESELWAASDEVMPCQIFNRKPEFDKRTQEFSHKGFLEALPVGTFNLPYGYCAKVSLTLGEVTDCRGRPL